MLRWCEQRSITSKVHGRAVAADTKRDQQSTVLRDKACYEIKCYAIERATLSSVLRSLGCYVVQRATQSRVLRQLAFKNLYLLYYILLLLYTY